MSFVLKMHFLEKKIKDFLYIYSEVCLVLYTFAQAAVNSNKFMSTLYMPQHYYVEKKVQVVFCFIQFIVGVPKNDFLFYLPCGEMYIHTVWNKEYN